MKLKSKSAAKWIKIGDAGEEGEILLKPLTMEEANRIREKHTRRKIKRGVETERIDTVGLSKETYAAMVLDWRGMKDEDGRDFPFSRENLDTVVNNDQAFLELVDSAVERLGEEAGAAERASEKNS